MFTDLMPLYPMVVPFLLVFFRLLGMVAFVPFFSNTTIPGNVKVLLGLAVTLCVWNVVPEVRGAAAAVPPTLPALVVAVAGEMTVGLVIGLMVSAVFMGVQLGGHMISQQMGLSLATLYDPSFEDQSTVMEQAAFWVALVVFLAMGGHREVINAVVYSFKVVPLGSGGLAPDAMLQVGCGALETAYQSAVRVAMPALAAFFLATLAGGLISRTMPQLGMMSLGITLHLLVGFFMVMFGLAGWALVARESFQNMFHTLTRLLG